MRLKKLIVALSLAALTVCAAAAAGCAARECETHTYGEWSVTRAATCNEEGERTRACTVCGAEETEKLAKDTENHTGWSEWTVAKAATCKEEGERTRVCAACGEEETENLAKDAENHTWSEWTVDADATCTEPGEKHRVCLGCNKVETAEVAVDPDAHRYGAYFEETPATCAETGFKKHRCEACGNVETITLPVDPDAHDFADTGAAEPSTCTAQGHAVLACTRCGAAGERELPLDPYAHASTEKWGGYDRCVACGGILQDAVALSNEEGKYVDSLSLYLEGDFELTYTFSNVSGENGEWHNFIFDIAPFAYLNGERVKLDNGDNPMASLIPFYTGSYYDGDHPYIKKYGGWVETTWFHDADGRELGFGECMKMGTDVTATLKRTGANVSVQFDLRVNGGAADAACTVTAQLCYPGVKYLYVALTGERNRAVIRQISVAGAACPEAIVEEAQPLLNAPLTLDNTGTKNAEGADYAFEGDFDLELSFVNRGGLTSDWHNFVFYVFKGWGDVGLNGGNVWWSGSANGGEPIGDADVFHNINWWYGYHSVYGDDFTRALADSKVTLRITRTNGYMTAFARVTTNDAEEKLIEVLKFVSGANETGLVTVRLSGENCVVDLREARLYAGEIYAPETRPESI